MVVHVHGVAELPRQQHGAALDVVQQDRRAVPAGLSLEPACDLPELLAARKERVPADVPACLALALDDDDLVAPRCGDPRVLQP